MFKSHSNTVLDIITIFGILNDMHAAIIAAISRKFYHQNSSHKEFLDFAVNYIVYMTTLKINKKYTQSAYFFMYVVMWSFAYIIE